MTLEEKTNYMRTMGGSEVEAEKETTLHAYLLLAKDKLLNHIYPYGNVPPELESRYDTKQIELAIILYNKKGAEGEDSHNENGVNRKYISEEQFLSSIPRKVGIPK